jgi:hypothetical protein
MKPDAIIHDLQERLEWSATLSDEPSWADARSKSTEKSGRSKLDAKVLFARPGRASREERARHEERKLGTMGFDLVRGDECVHLRARLVTTAVPKVDLAAAIVFCPGQGLANSHRKEIGV